MFSLAIVFNMEEFSTIRMDKPPQQIEEFLRKEENCKQENSIDCFKRKRQNVC